MARRLLETRPSMALDPRSVTRMTVRRARGFTLVELAIVVTIVGVLAVIAVVGYRKLTLQAKVSEAQNMISAIRIAQEDYRTERGIYANIGPTLCPSKGDAVPQVKVQWDPLCSGGGTSPTKSWRDLPVHADGPVQFGYMTIAPPAALDTGFVTNAKADTKVPWYVIQASCDLNGDGPTGLRTELVGTSFQNTIFARQEGE